MSGEDHRALFEDPRPVLPEPARAPLTRLFAGGAGEVDEIILRGIFDRLQDFGYRLHPFDLPRLAAALRRNEDRLGPAERSYLHAVRPDAANPADAILDQAISADIWTDYPRAARLQFLRDLRAREPAAARGLIEDCFAGEPANLRFDFLETLAIGLSDDDRPFLESLGQDRARKVKEKAQELLQDIRGTNAYHDKLSRALEILALKKGLLDRKPRLTAAVPKALKGRDRPAFIRQALSGLWISDLGEGLGIELDALQSLLPQDDSDLAVPLMACALAEGNLEALSRLAATQSDCDFDHFTLELEEDLARRPLAERAEVIRLLFTPDRWPRLPNGNSWRRAYAALDGTLPERLAVPLLESRHWRSHLDKLHLPEHQGPEDDAVLTIAVATPATCAQRLVEDLAPLPLGTRRSAFCYAEFQAALEAAGPADDSPLTQEKTGV